MKLAILYGGRSAEHEVSRVSAHYIAKELIPSHKVYLIGITPEGRWYLQPEAVSENCLDSDAPLELRTDAPRVLVEPGKGFIAVGTNGIIPLSIDVVIPVLHGTFGEDGTVQGLLACAGIPYVGCDQYGSVIGMDKAFAKIIWQHAGLPVVPFLEVKSSDLNETTTRKLIDTIEDSFQFPVIVKPCRAGSSVGIKKADNAEQLTEALKHASLFDSKLLVEPFLKVREIECSVIGNLTITSFPPGEVKSSHEFYDYEAKYIDPDGAELYVPADLSLEDRKYIQDLAEKAYVSADCRGLARVDFFIDTKTNKILLNEINTMPGFTSISMFPKLCEHGGLAYRKLLETELELALDKHRQTEALFFKRA